MRSRPLVLFDSMRCCRHAQVHLRFFCGPNAMKSEALSKAQKKKPKGGSSQKEDIAEAEEAEEEELELEDGGEWQCCG